LLRAGGLVMKKLTAKGLPTSWQAVTRANEPKESGASLVAAHLAQWWANAKAGKAVPG